MNKCQQANIANITAILLALLKMQEKNAKKYENWEGERKSIEILNLIDCFDSIHSLTRHSMVWFLVIRFQWEGDEWAFHLWVSLLLKYTHYVCIYTHDIDMDVEWKKEREREEEKIGNLSSLYTCTHRAAGEDYFRVASETHQKFDRVAWKKN